MQLHILKSPMKDTNVRTIMPIFIYYIHLFCVFCMDIPTCTRLYFGAWYVECIEIYPNKKYKQKVCHCTIWNNAKPLKLWNEVYLTFQEYTLSYNLHRCSLSFQNHIWQTQMSRLKNVFFTMTKFVLNNKFWIRK